MTPTDEQKRAWRMSNTVRQFAMLTEVEFYMLQLADFARDALAKVRRLEFREKHRIDHIVTCAPSGTTPTCQQCGVVFSDPRHAYTANDWKRLAEKELSE